MDKDITKHYTNGEVTIVWKPNVCIHSTICWKEATGLPEVFNPRQRPWIHMETTDSSRIVEQVKKCPSGALSYFLNNEVKDPA
ncbi:MAG: (4Fe-4S)-binding protein [Bacteroidota bacterium]